MVIHRNVPSAPPEASRLYWEEGQRLRGEVGKGTRKGHYRLCGWGFQWPGGAQRVGASGAQVANLSVGIGSSRSGGQAAFPGELQVPLATPSQAQICFLQSKQSRLTEHDSYLL